MALSNARMIGHVEAIWSTVNKRLQRVKRIRTTDGWTVDVDPAAAIHHRDGICIEIKETETVTALAAVGQGARWLGFRPPNSFAEIKTGTLEHHPRDVLTQRPGTMPLLGAREGLDRVTSGPLLASRAGLAPA